MIAAKSTTMALCALALATATASAQTYVYQFDAASSGVQGNIKVQYAAPDSSKASITADLDFAKVDLAEIQKADANCTGDVTAYKWHIHVKWSSPKTNDKFGMCSLANAGNHYDPTFACGPASEYFQDPKCADKIKSYACNPANYAADASKCEKGDLSGKYGEMKLDGNKKIRMTWTDNHFPLEKEFTPQWNMLLHASCGKAPRVACAIGKKETKDLCLDQ
ncbi:hypothetical protein ATCC90586_007298 [Pythium insidiosum]|nr:hypothetical protein ATCC90586_007298 [Pythium insidiosum]